MEQKSFLRFSYTALLALIISASACKKDTHDDDHDHDTGDRDKPVLTISSPTDMQIFYSGDTVKIKGLVTDASLHELSIKIIKDSDSSVLFSESPVVHDLTTYTINTFWKSSVSDHTNASLVVTVEDHSSNISTDTVHIHIMP